MAIRSKVLAAKAVIAVAAALALAPAAQAQIPVTDIILNVTQTTSYAEQLLQYAEEVNQYVQMLEDYNLQLQNLQQLPGTIRNDIQNRLATQLASNVSDFGVSYLGAVPTLNPSTGSFYANAENLFRTAFSATPRSTGALAPVLTSLGIPADPSSPMYKAAYQDRLSWERLLDDMRQSALARQSAQNRAAQANAITSQMRSLGDNNTVGAIQLLAGQQSLAYAQQEDILKTQAQTLRTLQQKEAQALAEQDDFRQHELDRLNQVKSRPVPTGGAVPVF